MQKQSRERSKYTEFNTYMLRKNRVVQISKIKKAYNTWGSQAVTHPSTNQAQRCLYRIAARVSEGNRQYKQYDEFDANQDNCVLNEFERLLG